MKKLLMGKQAVNENRWKSEKQARRKGVHGLRCPRTPPP